MILKNRSASFRQELNLRDLGISQGEMWEGIRWAELIECERETEIQHLRYICTEQGVMRDGRTILWESLNAEGFRCVYKISIPRISSG